MYSRRQRETGAGGRGGKARRLRFPFVIRQTAVRYGNWGYKYEFWKRILQL